MHLKNMWRFIFISSGICLIPLAFWVYTFWAPEFSRASDDWSDFGGFMGGVLSPILAFASFIGLLITLRQQQTAIEKQKQETDGEKYFRHAVTCLERAFSVLSTKDTPSLPVCDRFAWLTCARLILLAKDAYKEISPDCRGIKLLYEGEEEHWRRRFYDLLQPTTFNNDALGPDFFRADNANQRQEIYEGSIRIIYEFTEWPKDKPDPIKLVPNYTKEELNRLPIGMIGVQKYILGKRRFEEHENTQTL